MHLSETLCFSAIHTGSPYGTTVPYSVYLYADHMHAQNTLIRSTCWISLSLERHAKIDPKNNENISACSVYEFFYSMQPHYKITLPCKLTRKLLSLSMLNLSSWGTF